jgi:hypothetical protein
VGVCHMDHSKQDVKQIRVQFISLKISGDTTQVQKHISGTKYTSLNLIRLIITLLLIL